MSDVRAVVRIRTNGLPGRVHGVVARTALGVVQIEPRTLCGVTIWPRGAWRRLEDGAVTCQRCLAVQP